MPVGASLVDHCRFHFRINLISVHDRWRACCPFFSRPRPKIGVSFNESNAYMSQMVFNEIDSPKEEEEGEGEEEKQEMAFITLNFISNTFAYISFLQRSILKKEKKTK
uniref:Uncharacterized protein n=1 Tax=Glossina palpalis gambiensis TaxID=67801 RepID=A0A1B0BIQ7_9MUSC